MVSMREMTFDHLVGRELGTATLLRELGRGGMAVIFVAFQRTLKRQIAVKILPKSFLTPHSAEQFQQEAEAAAILSHPNIIQVYEVGAGDDFLFFTMQLIQGRPLSGLIFRARKHVVPSKRFVPLKASLKMSVDVLDALAYAHSQDIVHRDIKPANILIEKHTGRPIITDFGISKSLRDPGSKNVRILGTPVYMAPEQILNRGVDHRADIYAAGVMVFELLASSLPLADYGSTREMLQLKLNERLFVRKPSQLNPALKKEMDDIVFRALARDPGKRYATCREFADRLRDYQKGIK